MKICFAGRLRTLLSGIHSPTDVKKLSKEQLPVLADEIRTEIIDVVGANGGHLASNLGVVELTIALHRVFDSPVDAIVWDVSHQCYTHKLLTGRYDRFSTLRKFGGLSGFTKQKESPHDFFDNGHSSTSISSALGLLTARSLLGQSGKVVAVIGDGALTGGEAFEALSHAGQLAKNLIVILNDNQMSISPNTGGLSRYLSRLTMTMPYQTFRRTVDHIIDSIPYVNKHLGKMIFRFKRGIKGMFLTNNLFVDMGFEYVGPLDGHDINELETVLKRVKKLPRPVVVHVVTKKGKGYSPAEADPAKFHGIGPFCISDGKVEKYDQLSFTEAFSGALMELAKKRDDVAAITAAMSKGTGLDTFARHYPSRFFDVGIAEQHAVTFAGGLAAGGLTPIVCIYSTFMQRAVDQIIHDVALQGFHAVFMFDRAGIVPADGETHQGMFDITLLRPVPGIKILAPATAADLKLCLEWAVDQPGAVVIRYPKLTCPSEMPCFSLPVEDGKGLFLSCQDFAPGLAFPDNEKPGVKVLLVCTGGMYRETLVAARRLLMQHIHADIFSLRFIKPLDTDGFLAVAKDYQAVVIAEDGARIGGVGEYLENILRGSGFTNEKVLAMPDYYLPHGTRDEISTEAGLSADAIANTAALLAGAAGAAGAEK